jgi:peptidoglycan pentaglycine glycine transferase (the first glycine)
MTTVRELTEAEREYWNKGVQTFALADPLNAFEWGTVRSTDGWTPIYLCAERSGRFCGAMMILKKRLPFTPFSILYAQEMPVWDYGDDETLSALVNAAISIGKRERAIFLRVNPSIPEGMMETQKDKFVALGFKHLKQRWSFWNSPRDVARVDLTAFESPQHYFDQLPRNTRTSTRKARREGVVIEPATTKAELREFYEMFRQFSIERSFMVRDYAYQEKLWDAYLRQGMGRLLVAKFQGKVIGGSLDLIFAGKCLGMHGGSLYAHRGLGIDDAVNADVIMWAKERGCSWYSFRGLGSTPSQEAYKKKFMIGVVSLVGYYDLPFKRVLYKLFYWAEFTLLPFSWPLIIRVRRLVSRASKRPSQAVETARKDNAA